MARYLVTGGGGFIGSNLVEELLKRGEDVRVLDNFATGRRQNLTPYLNDIELIEGDLRSYHTVAKAVQDVDFILHQAALPSVPRSVNDPISSNDVNVTGIVNLLYAAKESRVSRVVYASSSSVYGDNPVSPKHESFVPNPKSPYAVSKITGEYYCKVFHQLYGLETVCFRYFNVFGPRQDPNSQYSAVIPKFLKLMKNGKRPTIYGDGLQSRDFTYVSNNVNANILACEAPGVAGKVYNIACGDSFSLIDLVNALNDILGTSIEPKFMEERAGDVKHSKADITAAKNDLMYKVEVNFREGLERLAASFNE
jgi:UDP-glucose 4-epimerase